MSDYDQAFPTKPPKSYQIERLETLLYWISEHSLELKDRLKPDAPDELENVLECVEQARGHLKRLSELLIQDEDEKK